MRSPARGATYAFAATLVVAAFAVGAWTRPTAAAPHGMRGIVAPGAAPFTARSTAPSADSILWMDMRNVDLHIDEHHVIHVRSLHGQVVATQPQGIAWLDDTKSFHIRATSGTVSLDGGAVTTLLNTVAFNYPGAPIKNLTVEIEGGQVVQSGTLHKGVDIPFTMWATPKLMPDGRLRLHPDRLRILGVNGLALMEALHLHLSSMMDLSGAHGVSVDGDDLLLDPLALIPPPTVAGHLSAVHIDGNLLVQDFARTADDTIFGSYVKPDAGARNFIYFRGGSLKFGRLTMSDTDLLIHDADESDPFDLFFAQYNRQLVAGHTANLPNNGLRTWMVDYGKLPPAPH